MLHRGSYLRSPWNIMDFVVVVTGYSIDNSIQEYFSFYLIILLNNLVWQL